MAKYGLAIYIHLVLLNLKVFLGDFGAGNPFKQSERRFRQYFYTKSLKSGEIAKWQFSRKSDAKFDHSECPLFLKAYMMYFIPKNMIKTL